MRWMCPQCRSELDLEPASGTCPKCGFLDSTVSRTAAVSLMSAATAAGRTGLLEEVLADVDDAPVPSQVGPYVLHERLGAGGFGVVHRATDTRDGSVVAIKMPRRDPRRSPADRQRAERLFLQEGERTRPLRHANIVQVLDVGRDEATHMPYIVMEYLSGGTLQTHLAKRKRPLSVPDALKILECVARAIDHAHRQNIFHLDLKPSNIFLDPDAGAKVGDFGIALHEDETVGRGGAMGTLPYMSPEQLKGRLHLDGRSDIWSLGVVMYEALSNRRPFAGNDEQLSTTIREKPVRPLAQRDLKIPAEVDAICLRCLQKSPEQRFATAAQLARALRAARLRPRRRVMIASAAVFLGLAGVSGFRRRRRELLEDEIEPYVLTPLPLDGVAGIKKIAWPWFDLPPARLDYDRQEQRVSVENVSLALLQLGKTECRDWDLESSVTRKVGEHGRTGFFFGYHEFERDGERWSKFQKLIAIPYGLDQGVLRLMRCTMLLRWEDETSFQTIYPRPAEHWEHDRKIPSNSEFRLLVQFRAGFMHSVQLNGEPCPELGRLRETDLDCPPAVGAFGFVNSFEKSDFRDTRVRLAYAT